MISGRKLLLFLLLLTTGGTGIVHSQTVYINNGEGIFQLMNGTSSNERRLISTDCLDNYDIFSIAIYKDTMYYNTWSGALKRFKIGVPGSCETLIDDGITCNALTVDKNGIIYMATGSLIRYNPYTRETTNLGTLPFISGGDMIFFEDKLLLAGMDPADWSSGIYELKPDNLQSSKLYMSSPSFFGLLSYPVACGSSRYFGLSPVDDSTRFIEIDLANKTILRDGILIPERIFDAASVTETGMNYTIAVTGITKKDPDNCGNDNGSITLSASSLNNPVTYTLLNTGISQSSGTFTNLRGGLYRFRVADAAGCTVDTSIALAENIPTSGCNDVFIPNAFTPNNDGKNDRLQISVPSHFKNISLRVFNRWGSMVYQATSSYINWDGSNRGAMQPAGVYVYIFSYTDLAGQQKNMKGTLTLIQ